MLRYLSFLTVFAIVCGSGLWFIATMFPSALSLDSILPVSLYFYVLTAVFHFGLVSTSAGKPALFIRYYMAATSFKLLIHMMLLVVVALFYKSAIIPFTITFLVFYVLYTVYEVAQAYRHSRNSAQ
jgi:hypothetical protein